MIAAGRPKTPRSALKKPKPNSVARTTPIARRAENGAALICASPKGPGPPPGIRASAFSFVANCSYKSKRLLPFAGLLHFRRMLPIVVSTDEAHGGGARNVELLCRNPHSELLPKQHLGLMVDHSHDAIVRRQESLLTQFRLGFSF